MARVAVLTSGGVDSSVALCRMAEANPGRLTAFYLKIWLEDELAFLGSCPWEEDLHHVRGVCTALGVPLEVVSLQREYWEAVVGYTLRELEAGRTPSPDVLCNRFIKFAAFLDRAGPEFVTVASGHYARTAVRDGRVHLLRGADPVKDQTYFLSQLDQAQLARCTFPIGHLQKAEVREEARRRGLRNADRPDSQGICFLGRVPYDEFVAHHLGEAPGDIVEAGSDAVLGRHRGYWFYTVGQRRGLGLAGGPWYVVGKDVTENRVLVAHAENLDHHRRRTLSIPSPHWIAGPPRGGRLEVRVRHAETTVPCTLREVAGGAVELELEVGDPGIAPGQFAVVYDGQECLGGGAMG
jgi:tRNA-specific 2-thiouridylase